MWPFEQQKSPYIRLNSPIPIIILERGMLIKETAVPATHVMIADHPSFPDPNRTQILKTIHEPPFIDPFRK
jgi:hypothetical protein